MDNKKAILWTLVLIKGIFAEDYDFRGYGVFKTKRVGATSSKECNCTKSSSEPGFEWGDWPTCNRHGNQYLCHEGLQIRTRTCSESSEGPLCREEQFKYCYHKDSCNGAWQEWTTVTEGGECSHTCGGGIRTKVRVCTLNNKIGLHCKSDQRLPYETKKEACNTQRCPKWSDWIVDFVNCSSTAYDGIITTRRVCVDSGLNGERCGSDKNMTEETVIRNCNQLDVTTDKISTKKSEPSQSEFAPNTLTYVLVAILLLLMMSMLMIGMCVCYKKRRRLEHLRNRRTEGIFRGKSLQRGTLNSTWLSRQDYKGMDILSQYSDSTVDTKCSERLRQDTIKTRKISLTSFEEPSSIYTSMSGSSSSGSRETSVKSQVENSEFPKNIIVKLPIRESDERYTSSPSPHSKRNHDSNRRKQQLRADGYIESSFLGFNRTKTKDRSTKRQKRDSQRKSDKDGEDDFDYVDYSTEGSRSTSRNDSRRGSERSKHLYAEIREFKPGDAPGKVMHAPRDAKLFASRETISAL